MKNLACTFLGLTIVADLLVVGGSLASLSTVGAPTFVLILLAVAATLLFLGNLHAEIAAIYDHPDKARIRDSSVTALCFMVSTFWVGTYAMLVVLPATAGGVFLGIGTVLICGFYGLGRWVILKV